ncbi:MULTISPECIES: SigE family RNA polymerase sigma factor [Actinosynnema]|uniref:SigE family RNA polymerase sigma factor n=1 Tax=Actinosynnema TaxID=40566 RepID=UPI0020A50358|nr:SigE family RNA polymerase sigma factor [Actinosynnema pretiosum]MCP2098703.1 RNA polymerase sigma-70 factor, sigma-E family [Actinosynnema pretiosum]
MSWDAEFTRHFDRSAASMRFTAYLLCGNWHEAEDVVQAAYLKLYLAGPRMAHRDGVDAYLRQIVVRTFLGERRKARWKRERVTDELPEVGAPAQLSEDRVVLWRALDALPAKQRAVIVLRFWHDLGVDEVARSLRCTSGTVKSHTSRGLAALRRRLGADFAELWPEVSRNA